MTSSVTYDSRALITSQFLSLFVVLLIQYFIVDLDHRMVAQKMMHLEQHAC